MVVSVVCRANIRGMSNFQNAGIFARFARRINGALSIAIFYSNVVPFQARAMKLFDAS